MKRKALLAILMAVGAAGVVGIARLHSGSTFDARKWKFGGPSSRGAMVQDLIGRAFLAGRSRSEILELLGQPDYCGASSNSLATAPVNCEDPKVDWFGYRVVTISRCYFWECSMNVNFSEDSYRVNEVNVSD